VNRYITVTSGIRGYFAVMIDNGEPHSTGIGSYETPEIAATEARSWAEAEGLRFIEPGKDTSK
jgi:hypothetical protein